MAYPTPLAKKNAAIMTADIPAKMENILKQDFFVSLSRLYSIEIEKKTKKKNNQHTSILGILSFFLLLIVALTDFFTLAFENFIK